ncbi:MAG: hypothetical protein H0T78_07625 [Longispora sp.]|nr:hypothetical protein [Longispora sp. (in: high G+C Gram-positive bacteria)]
MVFDIEQEFDRQVAVLLSKEYPKIVGMPESEVLSFLEPLRAVVRECIADAGPEPTRFEPTHSWAPFVLVVSEKLARAEDLVPLTSLAGGTLVGIVDRNHGAEGLTPYRALPELDVPSTEAYVLFDIERGEEFCNVRPADALVVITDRQRTPLTIHEGIALVTQYPGMLEKNRCFMLSGSRRGDRRVPAMWISGKAPKLGWCWEGNPHTWLGTASAGLRGATSPSAV